MIAHRQGLWPGVLDRFDATAPPSVRDRFEAFCLAESAWLDDFALYMAVKAAHDHLAWTAWPPDIAQRDPAACARWSTVCARDIRLHKLAQFHFFEQWRGLREACRARRIAIMGDLPIFVAHDSADVWAHRELFRLDADGHPTVVAGVPPDYFSATGQLWGNPHYRWDVLERTGYAWWVARFRALLTMVDHVRIDHFRGFEASWEVPRGADTAVKGRWVKGPGIALFRAVQAALAMDHLPFVAENLGVITPAVEALREQLDLPGMAILQFAFGTDPQAPDFRPHNYPRRRVVYTGTHDNDTTVGWWTGDVGHTTRSLADIADERAFTPALPVDRRPGDPLGLHPRCARLGRRDGHHSGAGLLGPRQRGADESARDAQRQLAMATSAGPALERHRRATGRVDRDVRSPRFARVAPARDQAGNKRERANEHRPARRSFTGTQSRREASRAPRPARRAPRRAHRSRRTCPSRCGAGRWRRQHPVPGGGPVQSPRLAPC